MLFCVVVDTFRSVTNIITIAFVVFFACSRLTINS